MDTNSVQMFAEDILVDQFKEIGIYDRIAIYDKAIEYACSYSTYYEQAICIAMGYKYDADSMMYYKGATIA